MSAAVRWVEPIIEEVNEPVRDTIDGSTEPLETHVQRAQEVLKRPDMHAIRYARKVLERVGERLSHERR